jgi:uncharacterized protein YbjT (DUF2867 family)
MTDRESPILVVGGKGKTGRRVADRLRKRGIPVRIGSRSAEPPFDWTDPATWAPALEGARAAFVTYYPDLALPGAPEATGALAELAVERGVPRLVLLSGRGEEEAQRSEVHVQASGADLTIVRCSWFNQNFSESFFAEPLAAGELALPAGEIPEPFVDCDDIADVAVAALTEDGHVGQLYELTGPRALTFAEAVEEIGRAVGRPLRFTQVSLDGYVAAMTEAGVPDVVITLTRFLFGEVLDGRNVATADGVQRALGRDPIDFADFARRAAATGVWAEPVVAQR